MVAAPTRLLLTVGLLVTAAPAAAGGAARHDFVVPGGPLGSALIAFGRQAGVSVGITDPGLAGRPTRGVSGRLTIRSALARLLAGTGATAAYSDDATIRVGVSPPPALIPRRRAVPPRLPPAPAASDNDIVITASKQRARLGSYPGAVQVADLGAIGAAEAARGSDGLVARVATLASTNLGPGRNKLFIRGAADSSFNGPSQATVGQYLGEVRLTYNAPDPNLSLYDVDRAEVLEGPQGTLYGTGSLGGIVRLIPNAPDTSLVSGSVEAGALTVAHGGVGGDVAAVINLPLRTDRLALRVVGYRALDPGYIRDIGQARDDVNRATTTGVRVALRYTPGDAVTLDVGGVAQDIAVRDGQYAQRGLGPLTRASHFAQPFDNDYRLVYATAAARLGHVDLISTTSFVHHELASTYDATGFVGTSVPLRFREDVAIDLLSHETRIAGVDAHDRSWVGGVALTHNINRLRRDFSLDTAVLPALGVSNKADEVAVFGQISVPFTPRLTATVGGRLTYSSESGEPLGVTLAENLEPSRRNVSATPLLALAWSPRPRLIAYVRYQEGARAGGLSVASDTVPPATKRFETDRLGAIEAGLRIGGVRDPLSFDISLSRARWTSIQSDLIDASGLPFTANIGDGQIFGLEARLTWRPATAWLFDASTFVNSSSLDRPAAAFPAARERELPNIAHAGARLAATYHLDLSAAAGLDVMTSVRYVGRSRLGIAPPFDQRQGDYVDTSFGMRLALGRFGITVDLTNLLDTRGNRFAFGNPFGAAAGDQITPLRPRAVRAGADLRF